MNPIVIYTTTDGNLEDVYIFYDDLEYEKFTEEFLDGYDDDRQRSHQLDWKDFPYKSYELQLRICEKIVKHLKKCKIGEVEK